VAITEVQKPACVQHPVERTACGEIRFNKEVFPFFFLV